MCGNRVSNVTTVLSSIDQGDPRAAEELLPLVYDELRRLADRYVARERNPITLQATALVHEAYDRLVRGVDLSWNGKGHFFGAAARAMRRILVDRARRYQAVKHGGDRKRMPLPDDLAAYDESHDMVALDDALSKLEVLDKQMSAVVHLRYFAGLSVEETAQIMGLSSRTIDRIWTRAKAWLYSALNTNRNG